MMKNQHSLRICSSKGMEVCFSLVHSIIIIIVIIIIVIIINIIIIIIIIIVIIIIIIIIILTPDQGFPYSE